MKECIFINSFIAWIGGKNRLKQDIVGIFPTKKYDYYIEVFGGAAWVLFHKKPGAESEIYNDLNGQLVNLFRVIKYHCAELQRELEYTLNSRDLFNGFKDSDPQYMTDIQRAARFFWVIKTSFAAKGKNFGCVKKDVGKMVDYLSAIQARLRNVVIENKDFERLISDFSNKDSLFYCDPPYYGTERYYSVDFTRDDHIRLYNALSNTKQRFILSYNDCPQIRDLYSSFNIRTIDRFNNLSTQSGVNSYFKELIITNY
jgi:DNA adenine methylase